MVLLLNFGQLLDSFERLLFENDALVTILIIGVPLILITVAYRAYRTKRIIVSAFAIVLLIMFAILMHRVLIDLACAVLIEALFDAFK